MRVLITGSAGLVGQELVPALEAVGHQVRRFDILPRAGQGKPEDICDRDALAAAMAGCDGVIHLAAISRVAWGEQAPELCHRVNVEGTQRVLETALAQARQPWVLFASSREVYGDPVETPLTEDAAIAPVNHYGRSKAAGEALMNAARAEGLRTAMLRLSNVYGTEYDHPDRAVPSLLWRAMAGEELRLTGAGVFFDFVHVRDCVSGFMRVAELLQAGRADLPPIHLTTGIATSLGELAELARQVAGSNAPVTVLPQRSFDVSGFCGKPDRAAELLGWKAEIGLREGLEGLREIFARRGAPPDPVAIPQPSQA